ncbi:MAG: extracellular solute-binding protein [Oscillospiraceae bacterium]|nr:extracellular solute-binding protein [Oscillospiraceae bacterium]
MKKILAMVLSLCLCFGLLAGCGSNGSTASSVAQSAAPTAAADEGSTEEKGTPAADAAAAGSVTLQEAAANADATSYAKEVFGDDVQPEEVSYPVDTDESLSLVATFPDPLFSSYPGAMADCSIYKAAEEATGIHVDFQGMSTSASNEQFNVMVASGSYPDLIGWGLNFANGDDAEVDEDVILDLTEDIAQYAPNYYNLLSTDDELLKTAVSSSGYITAFYGLTTEDGLAKEGLAIRTDELQKLGLEKPYTIDDYENVLAAFKDDGLKQPLMMLAPGAIQDNWLAGAFDVAAFCNSFPMSVAPTYVQDGEIKFGPVEDGFKDYITLMHDWYEKGYIESDFISDNSNWNSPDYANAITTGDAGIFYCDWGNLGGYIAASEIDGFALEATYDMHASEDSINHFGTFITKSASNGFRITTNCENVELACQWGDWWYSEEGSLLANYGVEGEGFEYVDGVPTFTSLVTDSDLGMRDALLVYASNGTINCVIDNNAVASGYSEVDKAAPEIWAKGMDDAYVIPTSMTLSADQGTEAANIYSDIQTLCMESIAKFITGDKSLDEFDDFVQQIEDMGIQDYLDIYQECYDDYMAR